MKYGELNLGQIEAVVNKLGGMEGVHKLLSGELMVKETECLNKTFKVSINHDKTLEEMIQAGKYDRINNDVTSDHFPIKGNGQEEKEIMLFHFDRVIFSDDAISEMAEAGYRPAIIEELLALGVEHKELQKKFPIVALGSIWRNPDGYRRVLYLRWGRGGRGLYLRLFGRDWLGYYRFAAVRNVS